MTDLMRKQVFRRLLVREAGNDPDSSALAVAACRLFERFAQQLFPIIGDSGVDAVYRRSLHLTQRLHPWLPPISAAKIDGLFTDVQLSLQQQDTRVGTEATLSVLTTMSELLAAFIGESLTSNLLSGAWPDDFAEDITRETAT